MIQDVRLIVKESDGTEHYRCEICKKTWAVGAEQEGPGPRQCSRWATHPTTLREREAAERRRAQREAR